MLKLSVMTRHMLPMEPAIYCRSPNPIGGLQVKLFPLYIPIPQNLQNSQLAIPYPTKLYSPTIQSPGLPLEWGHG